MMCMDEFKEYSKPDRFECIMIRFCGQEITVTRQSAFEMLKQGKISHGDILGENGRRFSDKIAPAEEMSDPVFGFIRPDQQGEQ